MKTPTLSEINAVRRKGLRPQVVGCILHDKKLLFVYKAEHKLWQLPQGGIDNGETIEQAIKREMTEELGENFASKLKIGSLLGTDKLIFHPEKQGSRELTTDDNEKKFMLGKKYFFVAIVASDDKLDITETEFNDYKWLSHDSAKLFAKMIYQKGKRRLTEKIINLLPKQLL